MDIAAQQTLDTSGQACPMPIVKTKQALDKMKVGEVLKLISTDPGSVSDVKAFSDRTGHELLGQEQPGGKFVFYIRKAK